MNAILTYSLGVVVCSGLFLGFYRLALHLRTSFRTARIFLVGSLIVSAVIPAFDIPVWRSAPVEMAALNFDLPAVASYETPAVTAHTVDLWPIGLWGIYLIGTGALLSAIIYQSIRIRRMKRRARICVVDGCKIAISKEIVAPFSFLSTVYVCEGTSAGELRQILFHESSHIRHRHSVEKIIMELLKTAMWFNPFAWIASRLLNEVHEFEADDDVLRGGFTVEEYLPIIFKQVFGYIPEISTGLGNSLTKKRFQMMTRNLKHKKYSWLRTVGVLPIAAGMIMLFGFTHRAPEIIMTEADTSAALSQEPAETQVTAQSKPVETHDLKYVDIVRSYSRIPGSNDTIQIEVVGAGNYQKPPAKTNNEAMRTESTTVRSYSRISGSNDTVQIEVFDAGATRKAGVTGSSQAGMIIHGIPADVIIWDAGGNREISKEELGRMKSEEIKNFTIFKDNTFPDEFKQMIGDRDIWGLIVINSAADKETGMVNEIAIVQKFDALSNIKTFERIERTFVSSDETSNKDQEAVETKEDKSKTIEIRTYSNKPETPVDNPYKQPVFAGGHSAMVKYMVENVNMPKEVTSPASVEVKFTVKSDGSIDNVVVLKSPHKLLSDEVARVVKAMPKWTPGEENGKPVAVDFLLLITIMPEKASQSE